MKHIENKEKRQRRGEKEKTEIRIIQLMNISREKIKTHKRKDIKQKNGENRLRDAEEEEVIIRGRVINVMIE